MYLVIQFPNHHLLLQINHLYQKHHQFQQDHLNQTSFHLSIKHYLIHRWNPLIIMPNFIRISLFK